MLIGLLQRAARHDPRKTAVVSGSRRLDYGSLLEQAEQRAAGLYDLGLRPGDVIAAVLPNGVDFVVAFFAAMRLGAVLLPLNPNYTSVELERFITDGRARSIVTDARRMRQCRQIVAGLGGSISVLSVDAGDGVEGTFCDLGVGLARLAPTPTQFGPALYLYTSGSTDTHKRVCCTQENLYFEAHNFVATLRLSADDAILCAIPLYHSYGIGNALLDAVYQGSTLVIMESGDEDPDGPFGSKIARLFDLIARENVRVYPGVPYQFAALAALGADSVGDLTGLRYCFSSGDVLPRATFERFKARYGRPIRSLYGSTEAGSVAIDAAPEASVAFGSLGRPLANVELDIRDGDGRRLPVGEAGTIWVKSPVIPDPVYDNRAPDEAVYRDRFFNTGDEGLIDAAGRLVMTGRKQSFLDIAGYKVEIAEVEEALRDCPGVSDAVALGVEVPRMGTLIKAVVVAPAAVTDADIRAHCLRTLAFFKVPRLIERRDRLPRSSIGKILKGELQSVDAYLAAVRTGETLRLVESIKVVAPGERRRRFERLVVLQVADMLGVVPATLDRTAGFTEMGFDSFNAIELAARLDYVLDLSLPDTLVFDYPTIAAVADFLNRPIKTQSSAPVEPSVLPDDDILARLERQLSQAGT